MHIPTLVLPWTITDLVAASRFNNYVYEELFRVGRRSVCYSGGSPGVDEMTGVE
jgi:hypothetical protein